MSLGWLKGTPRARFSAVYSGSYMTSFNQSSLSGINGLNQSLGFQASRHMGRWTSNFVVSAGIRNAQQSLLSPTASESLTAVPATFDALSQVMTGGILNSGQ